MTNTAGFQYITVHLVTKVIKDRYPHTLCSIKMTVGGIFAGNSVSSPQQLMTKCPSARHLTSNYSRSAAVAASALRPFSLKHQPSGEGMRGGTDKCPTILLNISGKHIYCMYVCIREHQCPLSSLYVTRYLWMAKFEPYTCYPSHNVGSVGVYTAYILLS